MHDSIVLVLLAALAALIFLQAGLLLLVFVIDERAPLSFPESLSTAFGFGVGLMTFQMLFMSLAGISLRLPALLAPWGLAWLTVAITARGRLTRGLRLHTSRPPERLAVRQERLAIRQEQLTIRQEVVASTLLCLLGLLVLLVFYHAWLFPVFAWDAWAIWDLKARAFFHHADIKPFLADGYYGLTHLDYPLLYPLAGTLLYLVLQTPHHIVQFIPATFYVCSLVQYACALRRLGASNVLALAFTFGLACLPPYLFVVQQFLSESAFVYYFITSTIYLFLYLLEGHASFLLLSAFAAGFMTQVRPEGILLLVAPVGILALRGVLTRSDPGWNACALYAGIALALFLPWAISSRFLTAPEGRLVPTSWLSGLLTNAGAVVRVLSTTAQWMAGLRFLGPFTMLAPVAAALVALRWKHFVGHWAYAFLLAVVVWSYLPYLGFLIINLVWLVPDFMGRYMLASTVALYFLVTSELVTDTRESPTSSRFHRLVLTAGGFGLVLWLGADLLGWHADRLGLQSPSPVLHVRPMETARRVLSHTGSFAWLTPLQRIQQLELDEGRMQFASMLSALLPHAGAIDGSEVDPLPRGDVILFGSSANPDTVWGGYLCQRLYYLLYPRKVRVINDPANLQKALSTSRVAALIVYDQTPPWDCVGGDAIFRSDSRHAVIRAPKPCGS
jgi:hypothetical protein